MNYRIIDRQDKNLWNDYVANSPRGHIFQSYEWGDVMANLGWEPLRLMLEDKDDVKGCISILKKKIRTTPWSILYSPRGPVLDFDDSESLDCMLNGIRDIALTEKAVFLQIVPNLFFDENNAINSLEKENLTKIEKNGIFRLTQPLWVYRIDLSRTEDEILSQMKRKTRYSVRLSIKKGVTVKQRNHFDDLKIFYEMLRESSKRKKFPLRSFAYFKSIWQNLAPNGNAKLFFADYNGKPLAGELVLKFGNMCWDMYRASMNHHKNLRPNYALQWKIMQWARNNSCDWYSLRGVPSFNPPPGHTGYGVYKFKKGFGGTPLTFAGDYYYIFKPKLYGYWEKGEVLINIVGRLLLKLLSG